jgi:hypothetical protein
MHMCASREAMPQSIRALRLRAGFKNRLRMNVPRPGPYIFALASLGRESKMLFPSKEHQLCCDADTLPGYFPFAIKATTA